MTSAFDDELDFVIDTRGDASLKKERSKSRITREESQLTSALFGARVPFVGSTAVDEDGGVGGGGDGDDGGDEQQPEERAVDSVMEALRGGKRARKDDKVAVAAAGPVWEDPEDEEVRLSSVVGGRKMRRAVDEHVLPGAAYEQRLREQFEAVAPTPAWAQVEGAEADEREGAASFASLFATTKPLTASADASRLSERDPLPIKRLTDINASDPSNSVVASVQFHATAPVALTAGRDRTLRLFQVSEKRCTKLHSAFFLDMPIASAKFVPHTNDVLCVGFKKLFYIYDMEADVFARVPHLMGHHESSWRDAVPAPDGKLSAFLGGASGNVALFAHQSRTVAQTLRMNGPVEHAAFSPDGAFLWTAGPEAQVFKWDMRMTGRRCVSRFADRGGIGVTSIGQSPCSRWLAVGDRSGMVNVYDTLHQQEVVQPHKTIGSLVTSASRVVWNHDSQLLAVASLDKPDALRVLHVPTFSVFQNWPAQVQPSPLGHVSDVAFSPHSGYLAVGNSAGKALLYRMLSFAAY